MPRRKNVSSLPITEQIQHQEEIVEQAKKHYEFELERPQVLLEKDSALKQELLLSALQQSNKTYEPYWLIMKTSLAVIQELDLRLFMSSEYTA